MEPDDIAAVVDGFGAAARLRRGARARRRRGQRRPAQPGAPVPLAASPTSATTSGAPTGCASPARCSPRCVRLRATTRSSGCACRATSWRRGPGITPEAAAEIAARPGRAGASTTWSSCAARSSRSRDPARRSHARPASTSSSPAPSAAAVGRAGRGGRCRARSSTSGQAEWALADGACDAVEMTRAQIADPDLGGEAARGRVPSGSGRASSATRRARCATPATRS